jgi:ATP-dependent RNA helicase DDX1
MSAFEEMGVMPELIRAVEEQGWLLPTPVQQEAVPLVLGGGDVLAAAETGSGKTGAFALPVLQIAHEALTESTRSAHTATAKALTPAQTAALTVRCAWPRDMHSISGFAASNGHQQHHAGCTAAVSMRLG